MEQKVRLITGSREDLINGAIKEENEKGYSVIQINVTPIPTRLSDGQTIIVKHFTILFGKI